MGFGLIIFAAHAFLLSKRRRLHQKMRGLFYRRQGRGFFFILFCLLVKLARQDIVVKTFAWLFKHILSLEWNILIWFVGKRLPSQTSDCSNSAKDFFYDLMKVVVLAFMFYMNWTLTWIVIVAMPILVVITRFNQTQVQLLKSTMHKLPIWIRLYKGVTGMKIVQLFTKWSKLISFRYYNNTKSMD
jgi:ABC-type multidrug transport system fused ATPase/permease subunit